ARNPQVWRTLGMWEKSALCSVFRYTFPPKWACRRTRDAGMLGASPTPGKELSRRVERQIELTASSLWSEVAGRLRGALNDTTYRTWFAEAEGADLSDDTFVIGVPNDFTREWIEAHFLGLIQAAARDVSGHDRRIRLTLVDRGDAPVAVLVARRRQPELGMNPKYTFDSFVIGSSNRFALAAALAVA